MKTNTKAEVVLDLRRFISDWKRLNGLTDQQVVAYMTMIAAPYAEAAYVHLQHHTQPSGLPKE